MRDDPDDQAAIPHPRLGFFGVIDERMDVDLVGALAALRPQWQFVMIGPVVKIDAATLPRAPNIHWLGGRSYDELPRYLVRLGCRPDAVRTERGDAVHQPDEDAGIPRSRSAGRLDADHRCRATLRRQGPCGDRLHAARDRRAKSSGSCERPREAWLQKVDRHLASGSWDKTWSAMHRLMTDALADASLERAATLPAYATTPAE